MKLRTDLSDFAGDGDVVTDATQLKKTKFTLDYGCGDPFYNLKNERNFEETQKNAYDRQINETIQTLVRYPKIRA